MELSNTSLLICTNGDANTWYYVETWTNYSIAAGDLPDWMKNTFDQWNPTTTSATVAGAYVKPASDVQPDNERHLYLINVPGVPNAVYKGSDVGQTADDIVRHMEGGELQALQDYSIILRDASGAYFAMPRDNWSGTVDNPANLGEFTTQNMNQLVADGRLAVKQEPPPGTVDTHSVNCYVLNLKSFT